MGAQSTSAKRRQSHWLPRCPLFACLRCGRGCVKDFNIVSFGGFQMSGMAALVLDEDIVARLPAEMRPEAASILLAREQGERAAILSAYRSIRAERGVSFRSL